MSEMTIADLRRILTECAGEDESVDLAGTIDETPFRELGYDSLALMETAARIKQEFGVQIPDEEIIEVDTPGEMLALVNRSLVSH
jgi:act minimal PKS acyl carrier protein